MGGWDQSAKSRSSENCCQSNLMASSYLEIAGKVIEVTRSYIPNVYICVVDCGDVKVKFDVHSKVFKLKPGDNVTITISKELPTYREGEDLTMWGYVMSLKNVDENAIRMVLSLWGYIVIIETSRRELVSGFNVMDKVYFKVTKSGTS